MKKIDLDQYFKAYGLFCLAREYQIKCDAFETELNKIFDEDNGSHLSDAIYSRESYDTEKDFKEAIHNMGFEGGLWKEEL